jgi:hypothetical protein
MATILTQEQLEKRKAEARKEEIRQNVTESGVDRNFYTSH